MAGCGARSSETPLGSETETPMPNRRARSRVARRVLTVVADVRFHRAIRSNTGGRAPTRLIALDNDPSLTDTVLTTPGGW